MRKSSLLYTLLFIFLLINNQFYQATISSSAQYPIKKQNGDTYVWIWDELIGAPTSIPSDDVVFWGESLGPYHNYDELTVKLQDLNSSFPDIIEVFSLGKTYFQRDIWCVRITKESVTKAKTEFYIDAAHHARELISVEDSLYFIDKLVYSFQGGEYEDLLKTTEIYVIPMLNPDGISIMHIFPEQRKNLRPIDDDNDTRFDDEYEVVYFWNETSNRAEINATHIDADGTTGEDRPGGVDLNRNYGAYWNVSGGASEDKINDLYRGDYPFSENETRIVRNFLKTHFINYAISLHSGVEAIIAPWSHNSSLPTKDAAEFQAIIDELKTITGFPAWSEIGGYEASGTWNDYCYYAYDIVPITIETYETIWTGSYFDYYNPSGDGIISNCELVFPALAYMANEPHLTYTNNLPSVKITNPSRSISYNDSYDFSWAMDDEDNDPLNSTILISENGWNWTVLASNITEYNTYTWNLTDVKASSYYLKVAVFDGKDWVTDVSEAKLYVKIRPRRFSASFWIIGILMGGSALVYIFFNIRKTRKVKEMWDPKAELEEDKNNK
ncbi:MAG: M14 family zinc carboxypeptidase [Candidatus Thorarchaeota archaeon]